MDIKLYYIQLLPSLSEHYINYSQQFSSYQITLIPVMYDQLFSLIEQHKLNFLFLETNNLKTKGIYDSLLKKNIYFSLLQNKIKLFHLSSFQGPMQLNRFIKSKKYFHYTLPIELSLLCKKISFEILQEVTQDLSWPGKNKTSAYKIIFDTKA